MNLYAFDTVQEVCCLIIAQLSLPGHTSVMMKSGCVPAIIKKSMFFIQRPGVQEAALRALEKLSNDPSNVMPLLEHKCLHAIVHALSLHGRQADVQKQGFRTLCNLSVIEAARHSMLQYGCIEAAIAYVKDGNADRAALQFALRFLSNMSADSAPRMRMRTTESVNFIKMVARTKGFNDDPDCKELLKNLQQH